ncbi:unnamed protein product [Clonostachys rosea]|uniref:Carboxylic ester hydrolase n=1 Tax=Bionectria ochroleuca TaxID=29856 RepID=A0ABY6TZT0_BIOOC|nr:unnamed protein product [Clonostachys rosea]
MRYSIPGAVALLFVAAVSTIVNALTLAELCTVSSVQNALPGNGEILGVELLLSSVTASAVYNGTAGGPGGGGSAYNYCNVGVSYTHSGKNDTVVLKLVFPEPSSYKNRFYVGGGGGFSLGNSGTGGLAYGAAGAATDAGYDGFSNEYDSVVLFGNGSINWDATHMFGYQALGEMAQIGRAISTKLYEQGDAKVYTYFEGCSDGGRQGMSQAQRWGEVYDGIIAGAPAFRFAQQQILHLWPAAIEHTQDYYPPPCELSQIVTETIKACDSLDGREDGVVSRTDLCQLKFDLESLIGKPYYCAEKNSTGGGGGGPPSVEKRQAPGGGSSYQPEQNGNISAEGVAVAQAIYDGPKNTRGDRAYLSWQIASDLGDATTTYNKDTAAWELNIPSMGGKYVTRYVQLIDIDNLSNLDNVTYDTLVGWTNIGMVRWYDSLQTTLPDLTPFQASGGKLLHFHGESDSSIPSASSARYWQSVRDIMYPSLSDEEAITQLQDWYQFYQVPGAGHCGSNNLQPGPYPQNNMDIIIDWVENGKVPTRLNATVTSGDNEGEVQLLCQWPTRPLWRNNSDVFDCVTDEESLETWNYEFAALKLPVF